MGNQPYVITISRQLGSGGAYLGQNLAKRLNIVYLDRDLIGFAARELNLPEEELVNRDEKVTSRWPPVLSSIIYSVPPVYPPPVTIYKPSDKELFEVESDIIKRIAREYSAVIVGRGGSYVLRQHPRHISVFLHADIDFRAKRIAEVYRMSYIDAKKLVVSNDKERANYIRAITGSVWTCAELYQLCINTGKTGLNEAEEIVVSCVLKNWIG